VIKHIKTNFLIKSIDEHERIIAGIASTPSPDRMGDIVNPLGAKFALPLPFLWQHKHDQAIGHVIEARAATEGITFRAQVAKTNEPGKLKDLLDFAWQSIKMRLVAAVSIGFQPIKHVPNARGGIEFLEWTWLELSAVTIPANPDATINNSNPNRGVDAAAKKARLYQIESELLAYSREASARRKRLGITIQSRLTPAEIEAARRATTREKSRVVSLYDDRPKPSRVVRLDDRFRR
jgi:HK97 family phage prohead protease